MKKHLYIIALFVFAIVSCISNMEVGSPFTEGQEVTITYSATVTEAAVDSKTTKNTLVFTYSKSPKEYDVFETITKEEIYA